MADPFCSIDLVKAVVYCGFWYWQWTSSSMRGRRWYDTYRKSIPLAPPGWLFGVMWAVIFTLLGVSTYLYARNFQAETFYTASLWILLANAFANKLWSALFFDRSQVGGAMFLLALFVLPTALLIPIFMALDGAYVAFGLWLLYPVWLLVALYLNWNWFKYGFPTKDEIGPLPQRAGYPPSSQSAAAMAADAAAVVAAPTQRVAPSGVMVLDYAEPMPRQRNIQLIGH